MTAAAKLKPSLRPVRSFKKEPVPIEDIGSMATLTVSIMPTRTEW